MAGFDLLTPEVVLQSVAQVFRLSLEGSLVPYPSYINRVYGVKDDDGREYIVKFYRPGRWTYEAVEEEHLFLADCGEEELPVITPVTDEDGDTLFEISAVNRTGEEQDFLMALFPKRGGRSFDAEGGETWYRLGRLLGRLHIVGRRRSAAHRVVLDPAVTSRPQLDELLPMVHPELASEFKDHCYSVLEKIEPLFLNAHSQRIHGDCHRGNILERPGTGLMLIDFDDMVTGPAVQDLWMLLPGRREESSGEIGQFSAGYEEFTAFPWESLNLVEPLRFMRMIHFTAWCARQRGDKGFSRHFPDWGTKAFWTRELEDLRDQSRVIFNGM